MWNYSLNTYNKTYQRRIYFRGLATLLFIKNIVEQIQIFGYNKKTNAAVTFSIHNILD